MNEQHIEHLLSALVGRRDKHCLATTRNFEIRHPLELYPPVIAGQMALRRFRSLDLVEKHPFDRTLSTGDARYVLTEKGRRLADAINERFSLALTIMAS